MASNDKMPEDHFREAYGLIKTFYGKKTAERSGVPLINHIDEGLIILDAINADIESKAAFCLHPLVQRDEDLKNNYSTLSGMSPNIVLFALEYRNIANAFLSNRIIEAGSDKTPVALGLPALSPLEQVNDMLIADKVQNYKDFLKYHVETHERAESLVLYFKLWLATLDVGNGSKLAALLDKIM